MKRYKAVLLDLFDTLVDFQVEKLPVVQVGGEAQRTTSRAVYEALESDSAGFSYETFHRAFVASYRELETLKKKSDREILAEERFGRLLQRLEIGSPSPALVERLIAAHMNALVAVMDCPPERLAVLDSLAPHYPLALVSNFDHHPTARHILDKFRLTHYFRKIVISGEVRWRKPGRQIFRIALNALAVEPGEALHVGDTLWADVLGAQRVGIDTVWLDRGGDSQSENDRQPDHVIHRFEELLTILGT